MSNSYTPNIKLAMPAIGDTGWSTPVNSNCSTLDGITAVGALAVTTTEVPSATLNVAVAPGSYIRQDGSIGSYAGTNSQTMIASSTQALYLDLTNSGSLAIAATYPSTPHVRLATVVAGNSTISSIVDNRQCFNVVGSWADSVNITLGTAIGTQIGTATNQKLGFFGKTPITQPTMGAATAGSSYTSNEQAMLNAVYTAVRALGLGS
ncbi:MAG: hypothetical protein ACLQGP_07975 [Isosphaeraceae bacterium]